MNFDKLNKITAGKTKTTGISPFSELELSKVYPNPNQPRKQFEDIEELASTILEHGLLQPITVIKKDDGYMIISGERRYKAHLHNDAKTIKAHIINVSNEAVEELTLIENIQRNDLTDFETAKHIVKLWESGRYEKKSDLAKKIGKSDSYISKAFSCLKLDSEIIDHMESNNQDISISVLDEIARVKDPIVQKEVYEKYNSGEITRDEIKKFKGPKKEKRYDDGVFEVEENPSLENIKEKLDYANKYNLIYDEKHDWYKIPAKNFPRENMKKYELEICCKDGILYQSDVIEAANKNQALTKAYKKYSDDAKNDEYEFFITEIIEDLAQGNVEEKQKFVCYGNGCQNEIGTYISVGFGDLEATVLITASYEEFIKKSTTNNYKITIEEI